MDPAVAIEADEREARVRLASGETLRGDRVVVAAGAYLPALLPEFLPGKLRVIRRVLAWTRPDEAQRAALSAMPVWAVFAPEGFLYGFPWCGEGVDGFKVARHVAAGGLGADEGEDPETVDRETHPRDFAPLEQFLNGVHPDGGGAVRGVDGVFIYVHAVVGLRDRRAAGVAAGCRRGRVLGARV
jgi:glycine/D-amino acid oxidase-like deaminating enzyme